MARTLPVFSFVGTSLITCPSSCEHPFNLASAFSTALVQVVSTVKVLPQFTQQAGENLSAAIYHDVRLSDCSLAYF
jgi:predicted ferric reductase